MVKNFSIKKGYNLNLPGLPAKDIAEVAKPDSVAAVPEHIPFIKPKLRVAVGDRVRIGSPLFHDKANPALIFGSPGGGEISDIQFGPRRVIREIVIHLDDHEESDAFEPIEPERLPSVSRESLVDALLAGGMWPLIRSLPFRGIADPAVVPPAIVVSLTSKEPFQPLPEVYLNGCEKEFAYGIDILKRLSGGLVHISAHAEARNVFETGITHELAGPYPADDPGVLVYKIKTDPSENKTWFVAGQDVTALGRFALEGKYPVERVMVSAGSRAEAPRHLKTRIGVPLALLDRAVKKDNGTRLVSGGVLSGYTASADAHMGLHQTALTLLPDGNREEFMALFNPGWKKPTWSRNFLSVFNRSSLEHDCNRHGGRRACIACMHCAEVCPVDIFPQMAYKAILAGEVEEALSLGMLDCVECGLCSFVCPSKIELTAAIKDAKAEYRKTVLT